MKPPTKCGRVHFEHSHRKWLVITVRPTTSVRKSPRKNLPPRNTPDPFCRRFTRQNHRCAAWAVFFFYGHLSGRRPLHLAGARPLCRLKAPLGLLLLRKRGILLSEETKNPNPSPIEKRFGFSWFGASSDTELFRNHRSTIRFQGHRIATCLYRTPMGGCIEKTVAFYIPHNLKIIKYAQRSLLPSPGANGRCFFCLQRKEASVKWQFFG